MSLRANRKPVSAEDPDGRLVLAAMVGQALLADRLIRLERRMRRTGGPGIIGFELAGTPERARRIMGVWERDGQAAARASLVLDFPCLVTYRVLQYAACRAAVRALSRRGRPRMANLAGPIAAAQVGAGACDAIENISLLRVLAGHEELFAGVAQRFTQAKFALLVLGWAYGALGAGEPPGR
jgi:hypothetical protein